MQKTAKILTKSALGFGLVLALTACSSNPLQRIEVSAKPIAKPNLNLPPVDELTLRNVDWIVVNRDNMEEKIAELEAAGVPIGLYVLTGEGYENLGLNISDIRALIQQQQEIIVAYENYYKQSEAAIEEHNQTLNE
jgi:hypothetical protein